MERFIIPVKYHNPDTKKLTQIGIGDAIDVRASEDVVLSKGGYTLIPLGFSMKLPKGHCALLLPRSSTFRKYGIIQTNSVGLIDESYCGNDDEWAMPVYALQDTVIPKGDRIAQFIIIPKMPPVVFEDVDDLGTVNRGGFGSTGRA